MTGHGQSTEVGVNRFLLLQQLLQTSLDFIKLFSWINTVHDQQCANGCFTTLTLVARRTVLAGMCDSTLTA